MNLPTLTKLLLLTAWLILCGPTRASTIELLVNKGFEAGDDGNWNANTLLGPKAAGITNGSYPYAGTYYGYVGNSSNSIGSLFQTFYVPAGAGIATISFELNVGSLETAVSTKYDVMEVNLRTYSPDTPITNLATFSNLDKAPDGTYIQKQFTYDLTAYREKYILLQFYGTNDSSQRTIFRVDDVSVSVNIVDSKPNITLYQPTGWDDKIIVSKTQNTTRDDTGLLPTDDLYVDWAIINNGTASVTANFTTELFIDDSLNSVNSWGTSSGMGIGPSGYQSIKDFNIGKLSGGTHKIRIKTDSTGAITESDETDNEYTKQITIIPLPPANFTAVATSTRITLGWSDAIGENDYELQWSTASAGPWNALGLAGKDGTSYPDDRASAGVTYWYQIRSRNSAGNSAWSSPISSALDAGPTSTSKTATDITSTSAVLNSSVNPRGVSIFAFFEYGMTSSYGIRTPKSPAFTGTYDQDFSSQISGLTPDATYHFRVVSSNNVGQLTYGTDLSFKTVADGATPTALISGDLTPVTGQTSYSGKYSTGTGLRYQWTTTDGQSSTLQTPTFSFNSPGRYSVYLTVTDSSGRTSPASINVNVQARNNGSNPGTPKGADPVILSSGNYIQSHSDMLLQGKGFPSEFRRFYNSKFSDQSGLPLGFGWTFNYNSRVVANSTNVLVIQGDGSTLTFFPNENGFIPEPGVYESLIRDLSDDTWTLIDKSQTRSKYAITTGKLLTITDKNNNRLQLRYAGGSLTEIENSSGRKMVLGLNSTGCISDITDPLGRTVHFKYDSNTNLIEFIDANNYTNSYAYNDLHQMTDAWDGKGTHYLHNDYDPTNFVVLKQFDSYTNWTYFYYDFNNRITVQTNAFGKIARYLFNEDLLITNIQDEATNVQTFSYDTNRNQTLVQDRNGNGTHYTYDTYGNLITTTDPSGAISRIKYDLLNNPVQRSDPGGNVTTFGYDTNGNLSVTTNALGITSRVIHDASGLPINLTDGRGYSTTNRYDEYGNLTEILDSKGAATRFYYDLVGRKILQVDALNRTNHISYDSNNNVTITINALGLTNAFLFDKNNNCIQTTSPNGVSFTNIFDLKNRLVSVRGPHHYEITSSFDALDRRVALLDSLQNKTTFGYDGIGNLTSITNPISQITSFTVDAVGNQTSVTDSLGHAVTNIFDSLNRKIATIDLSVSTNGSLFDSLGRVTASTNANGQVTRFLYDQLSRITNVVDSANQSTCFYYDANGNRVLTVDPMDHSWVNKYDELNRLVEQTDPLGFTSVLQYDSVGNVIMRRTENGDSIRYYYSDLNQLTNLTYPNGSVVSFAYDSVGNRTNMSDSLGVTTWQYDLLNRLILVTDPYGQSVQYAYDSNGNRISLTYPGSKVVNYGFDALNRLVALTNWLGAVTTYTYDKRGNLIAATNGNSTIAHYEYDVGNRLITLSNLTASSSVISSHVLTLDGISNHRNVTFDQPLLPVLRNETNVYSFDADNRLTLVDGNVVTHNPNGDITSIGPNKLSFDLEDRLTSFAFTNCSGSYEYDGRGNRLSRILNGVKRRFVLDQNGPLPQMLVETDSAGSPICFYVYGVGLAHQISVGGVTATYHFNPQGSTIALSDSTGSISDSYAYDSFGNLANANGPSGQPFRYLGEYGIIDDGTGLYFARARYFSPNLGRFVTKDPLSGKENDGQSLNRYIYALNRPLILNDISGLCPSSDSSTQSLFSRPPTYLFTMVGQDLMGIGDAIVDLSKGTIALPIMIVHGWANIGTSISEIVHNPGEVANAVFSQMVIQPGQDLWAAFSSGNNREGTRILVDIIAPFLIGPEVGSVASGARSALIRTDVAAEEIAVTQIPKSLTGYTDHGLNQAISRDGVGVSPQAILDAWKNPLSITEREGTFRFNGKDATIVVNSLGKIITTWANSSLGKRIK